MQHARSIAFLSLFIFTNSLPQENIIQKNIKNKPITLISDEEQKISKIIHESLSNQHQSIAELLTFSETDIEEMNLVFASSPKEAQCIVKHLLDPTFFELVQDYRSTTFVGEPGTGKTTMALAIAYTMTQEGWEYKFLSSTSLLGEHRNQTAIALQKEFAAIEASEKPTILIIDELNRLLENTDSKHHDTDTAATALWTFLDKQKGNKNFFFIGTMNRANKLPKPYKSRILLDYIKFPLINNPKLKSDFVRTTLTTKNTSLDAEVTDAFLDKELEKIGSCSGRDLKNISNAIYKISKINERQPSNPMVIKKATITHIIDLYVNNKIELDYDIEEKTDEQRQNHYHKENQEMQERHFIQQHMIQMALKDDENAFSNGAYLRKKGKEKINSLISDEQKQLYNDMMKNTYARETLEANIKAAADKAAIDKATADKTAAEKRKNSRR
jgi:AAA+ superfamily predicted ATPase